jgi:membrane protease YdiL (CAAX protease family)
MLFYILNICILSCLAFLIIFISSIKNITKNIPIIVNIVIWYTILVSPLIFYWFDLGFWYSTGAFILTIIMIILLVYKKLKNKQSFIYFSYNENNKVIIITTIIIYFIVIFLIFVPLVLKLYKNFNVDDFNDIIGFFLTFAIFVGICEELFFRGLLYNKLLVLYKGKKYISIIICSLIFGITHMNIFYVSFLQNIINFVFPFLLGILINISYEKSKNIIVPIMIHNIINVVYYSQLYHHLLEWNIIIIN